jgi:hypothetical protein
VGCGFEGFREFVAAYEQERDGYGEQGGGAADPERPLEAAAEGGRSGVAVLEERLEMAEATVDATATPIAPPSCCEC